MCCCGIIGSCFTLCCMHCCCAAIQECNGKRGPASRIPYIFLMFIACIFSAVMTLYGETKLYSIDWLHATLKICNSPSCEGNGIAYRTSFALLVFFVIHAIMVRLIMAFHWTFFAVKLILLIAFFFGSFWFPNTFFEGYAEFARIASIFFLVLQVLVLVVWAWDISDLILAKIELLEKGEPHQQDQKDQKDQKCQIFCYQGLLIATTLGLQAFCVIMWWLMFVWFGGSGCVVNQVLISLTIIAVVFLNAVSVYAERGSLFVASIVSTYGTYLCYSGLQSDPNSCNRFPGQKNTLSLWIGIVITAAALSYAGFSVSSSTGQALVGRQSMDDTSEEREMKPKEKDQNKKGMDMNEMEGQHDDDIAEREHMARSNYDDLEDNNSSKTNNKDGKKNQTLSDDDKIERNRNVVFHVCMALAAIYYAMLYTNWATDSESKDTRSGRGDISLGINISSEWLSFALYLWTLFAPKIFPNRVFD